MLPITLDSNGLVPVVVQDHLTGEIGMVAYANTEAVKKTLEGGKATFFSRSRGELWEKGQTSGNVVQVRRVLVDCDGDCLLYAGDPSGPLCHTGAPSCFFRELASGPSARASAGPQVQESFGLSARASAGPQTLLARLEHTLDERKESTAAESYTKSLYAGGAEAIGAKIREEAGELAHAVAEETDARVVSEAADVVYHLIVGLRHRGIALRDVLAELDRRHGTSGHAEKAGRSPKPTAV
jgi:phosphoribosyl-ATP pyrophosphohydrolase/phosphoribosyl-AMP cyclohydrolase